MVFILRKKTKKTLNLYVTKYTKRTEWKIYYWLKADAIKQWWMTHATLKLEFTADSGGYTMKWRRVKPKPCEVRRRRRVLGPGQENGSSSSWKSTPEESSWSTTSYRQTDKIMRKKKGHWVQQIDKYRFQQTKTIKWEVINCIICETIKKTFITTCIYSKQLWRVLNKIQDFIL